MIHVYSAIHIQEKPDTSDHVHVQSLTTDQGPCETIDLYNGTARKQDFMLAWLQLSFLAGDISMHSSAVTSALFLYMLYSLHFHYC